MARKRDYAAEYARRQERARERGFTGYYEQRTRKTPGGPKPAPDVLALARGHRGPAALRAMLDRGHTEKLSAHSYRNRRGQIEEVTVYAISDTRQVTEFRILDLDDWLDIEDYIGEMYAPPEIEGSP